ncbi:nuclear transport factor 2 family protein [Pseudomonas syringae]|uniref:nuclear transport factor 2 family protein n=1 Tax=Pseudomonas syringae TaxID=317 RepID=UPI0013736D73|nr:nuclear transport factor 2 family protein [Pseudomonas syringae]
MVVLNRSDLLETLHRLLKLWGSAEAIDHTIFDEAVFYSTSHRTDVHRRSEVISALASDFSGSAAQLTPTNIVVRGDDDQIVISAYLLGTVRSSSQESRVAEFGSALVVGINPNSPTAQINEIRHQVLWVEGDKSVLADWKTPVTDRLWQPGDEPVVLSSELDAPWNRVPASSIAATDEEAIGEAWFRYAWGLDLSDTTLLAQSFTDSVEAELMPMGHMQGRRLLVSTLKAFRAPWPKMQHCGRPLEINFGNDRLTASVLLGRIIPGKTFTEDGRALYGAHYTIEMRKTPSLGWQIQKMVYKPGWITHG